MVELLFDKCKIELQIADPKFNEVLLRSIVEDIVSEIKMARRYPETYTEDMISRDLLSYLAQAKKVALDDYSHVGAYNETSHTEGETTRVWGERDKLLRGINAIARF